jgi:hypothetical protein
MIHLLESIVPRDARIIEVGARDGKLARFLVRRGWTRYLGLATPEILRSAVGEAEQGGIAADFFPYSELPHDPHLLRKNNADVLILSGRCARHLWNFPLYAHAQYVAWSPDLSRSALLGVAGTLKALLKGRVRLSGAGTLELGPSDRRPLVVLKVTKPRSLGRKRFVSPFLERVFSRLREERVNYLVLRWFEEFPAKAPGKDIDVLVADGDIEAFDRVAGELPGIVECEVYSVSGLPGTDYHETAHFPPPVAERMLERAVWWTDCYRVPCPEDHFSGLAYHAVYHKGERSGIPSAGKTYPAAKAPSHDYAGVLRRMAEAQGLDVEVTLEGLDEYLHSRGLRPSLDTLARFARSNAWARHRVSAQLAAQDNSYRGLCNFYVRQRAIELDYEHEIIELLESEGVSVLAAIPLTEQERESVASRVRGGNWGRGPWPVSGGKPAMIVVGFDPAPIAPSGRTVERHPILENERILAAKKRIRRDLMERLPPSEHCNLLHSSDTGAEALECLRSIVPQRVDDLLAKVETIRQRGAAPEPMLVNTRAKWARST